MWGIHLQSSELITTYTFTDTKAGFKRGPLGLPLWGLYKREILELTGFK
jgi:hypothetical protein